MKSLAEQLKEKGLVSKKKFTKHENHKQNVRTAQQNKASNKFKGKKGIVSFDEIQLDQVGTDDEFKLVAREMLSADPQSITLIVQKAHNFREQTGNKKIVPFIYKVRDGLKKCPSGQRANLLKRMFRRSNPKFNLPQ